MKHLHSPRSRSRCHTLLRSVCPALVAAFVIGGNSAKAVTLTFDPGMTGTGASAGGGTWDAATTPDWYSGTGDTTFGTGNTASFSSTGGTVTLGSVVSALAADFSTPGYSIASSTTNTLTVTSAGGVGATSAIYASGTGGTSSFTGPVTFGAGVETVTANTATDVISFGGTIMQTAPGTATLTTAGLGTINYSGTAFVPGKFNINNAVFNSSGTVTVANQTYFGTDSATGATLNITGGTFNATGVTTFVGATGAPGTINLSGGTNTFTVLNVGNGFNGTGDGTGTVTITGGTNTVSGAIRLGSTDAGVGTLNINTGGRLIIGAAAGAITRGTGTTGTGGSGNINFNGGVLQYNAAPTAPAIAANITTTILDNGATISTNGSNITIASPIGHGGTAAIDGGLTKATNAGILTLSAANTYTGPTIINTATTGGTAANTGLSISVNGGLSSSNVTVGAATSLTLAATVTAAHSNTTSTLTLAAASSVVNLNATTVGTVQDTVGSLVVGTTTEAAGTYGGTASGVPAANQLTEFTGDGVIVVTGMTAVPEPSTWAMLLGGLGGLLALTFRRRRSA